jgi:hypothetical protein
MYRNIKTTATIAAMVAAALLSGCATIDTSNNIGFPVKTKPEGAKVTAFSKTLKTTVKCVSPCTMTLRQTHDYLVTIKKNGYEAHHIKVESDDSIEGDAGSFGQNLSFILLPPVALIGMTVDGISGADDRLFPGHANVTLKAVNGGKPALAGKVAQATSVAKTDKAIPLPSAVNDPAATSPVSPTTSAS